MKNISKQAPAELLYSQPCTGFIKWYLMYFTLIAILEEMQFWQTEISYLSDNFQKPYRVKIRNSNPSYVAVRWNMDPLVLLWWWTWMIKWGHLARSRSRSHMRVLVSVSAGNVTSTSQSCVGMVLRRIWLDATKRLVGISFFPNRREAKSIEINS